MERFGSCTSKHQPVAHGFSLGFRTAVNCGSAVEWLDRGGVPSPQGSAKPKGIGYYQCMPPWISPPFNNWKPTGERVFQPVYFLSRACSRRKRTGKSVLLYFISGVGNNLGQPLDSSGRREARSLEASSSGPWLQPWVPNGRELRQRGGVAGPRRRSVSARKREVSKHQPVAHGFSLGFLNGCGLR